MKSKTIGKILSAALLCFGSFTNSFSQCQPPDCVNLVRTGNCDSCCTSGHLEGTTFICDEWTEIGIPGMRENINIDEAIQIRNNGTTGVYDEFPVQTGGGLGDSNNWKAGVFGWKPITDTDFGRFWYNGYSNWTSPAVLVKSQYTGTSSDVVALKVLSKYATGKGIGAHIEGGSKGINVINSAGNAAKSTYGVYSSSTASAAASSASIKRYGGYFSASGGTGGSRYGLFATASGGAVATRYAGFFDYNVYVNGSVTALVPLIIGSDRKLKENISTEKNVLEKIMQLNPSAYHFKKELVGKMNLPDNLQHGLIAQDLEKVFPELVSEVTQPARFDPETEKEISEEITFKGVNYIGLIPLLIQSVKEQQQQIASLKTENDLLKSELEAINNKIEQLMKATVKTESAKSSFLQQNNPNPFNQSTEINYSVSTVAKNAAIEILSAEGIVIKTYPLEIRSNGKLHIAASTFKAGNYVYQLIVDGVKVDSKKMIVLN